MSTDSDAAVLVRWAADTDERLGDVFLDLFNALEDSARPRGCTVSGGEVHPQALPDGRVGLVVRHSVGSCRPPYYSDECCDWHLEAAVIASPDSYGARVRSWFALASPVEGYGAGEHPLTGVEADGLSLADAIAFADEAVGKVLEQVDLEPLKRPRWA